MGIYSGNPCGFEGCERKHYAKGYCNRHWQQWRAGRPMTPEGKRSSSTTPDDRFNAKFTQNGTDRCWEWTGASARGHGVFWVGDRLVYAHRYIFEREIGAIPDGFVVDHQCRNGMCVNPSHLKAVTPKENCENQPTRRSNKTGYRGVYFDAKRGTYYAQITHHGETQSFTGFKTAQSASEFISRKRSEVFTNSVEDAK